MSSRVHKTSQLYLGLRPEIDKARKIKAGTRRAQNAARVVAGMDRAIDAILSNLDKLPRKTLLAKAKEFDIKGRHTMTKTKLLEAIKTEMRRG